MKTLLKFTTAIILTGILNLAWWPCLGMIYICQLLMGVFEGVISSMEKSKVAGFITSQHAYTRAGRHAFNWGSIAVSILVVWFFIWLA